MILGYTRSGMLWGFNVKDQAHMVNKPFCILEPRFIDIRQVALPVVCGFADAWCDLH